MGFNRENYRRIKREYDGKNVRAKEEAQRRAEELHSRYPEIRDMVYGFISAHKEITPALVGDPSVIGEWHFVPEKKVSRLMDADMALIF